MNATVRELANTTLIILGIFSAACGLKGFLLSSRFIDGGVTAYRGHGGMGSRGAAASDRDILYCVVTRLEIGHIKNAVKEIDPSAFITAHSLSDVEGGLIKKAAALH